jgi:Uma2 family endonuclease
MITAPNVMTAEQLVGYRVPGKRVELVRGQLVVREPASFRYGDVGLRLGIALGNHLAKEQQANGWATRRGRLATLDPGFTLARNPDTVRAPDLAYVSRERHPAPIPDGFPAFAPDLAIEVRSPSDRVGAVISKVGTWLEAGTLLVWSIDPEREQVVAYRADGSISVLEISDTLRGDSVLPGFEMPLRELFADD